MADLTVTITESITLNGEDQGTTTTVTESSCAESFRRIVAIDNSEEYEIIKIGAANDGNTLVTGDFKYLRITNTHASNTVDICLYANKGGTDEITKLMINPGHSFLLSDDIFNADDAYNSSSNEFLEAGVTEDTITTITALASGTGTYIEIFGVTA